VRSADDLASLVLPGLAALALARLEESYAKTLY
jgi:hypothetical protein